MGIRQDILLEKYLTQKVRKMLLKEELGQQPAAQNTQQAPQTTQQPVGNPFDKIAAEITKDAGAITAQLKDPNLQQQLNNNDLNEGVLALAGLVLSVGKIAELAGSGLKKLGKTIGADEKAAINKVSTWLMSKGEAYSHKIEDIITTILSKTPGFSKLVATLNPNQKKLLGKAVLTAIVGGLAIASGTAAVKALLNSENLVGVIEGLLTGVKSSEILHNIPIIIKNMMGEVVATH